MLWTTGFGSLVLGSPLPSLASREFSGPCGGALHGIGCTPTAQNNGGDVSWTSRLYDSPRGSFFRIDARAYLDVLTKGENLSARQPCSGRQPCHARQTSTRQHEMEEESIRVLKASLPPSWVLHDYAPDYGIDKVIEVFEPTESDPSVSETLGQHVMVQLKAVESSRPKLLTVRERATWRNHPLRLKEVAANST